MYALLPARPQPSPFRSPAARGPGGRWLPEAPRTVTCHRDTVARPLPRQSSLRLRGRRSPGAASPLQGNRAVGPGREGAAAEDHLSSPSVPNPGSGVLRRKPSFGQPAPAPATGHAQCFSPSSPLSGFSPQLRGARGRWGPDGARRPGGGPSPSGRSQLVSPSQPQLASRAPQVALLLLMCESVDRDLKVVCRDAGLPLFNERSIGS